MCFRALPYFCMIVLLATSGRLVNVKDAPETHLLCLYCALENFVVQPVRTRASSRLVLNAIIHRFCSHLDAEILQTIVDKLLEF
jgi:hypothetical protein